MVSLGLKLYCRRSLIKLVCPSLAHIRPWAFRKVIIFVLCRGDEHHLHALHQVPSPLPGGFPILTIRHTRFNLSALLIKKQLFITIIYLRFYQNAMTLSSPRINGVATICFFSGLPSAKLIKFVTARQQMKRTVGATP